MNNLSAPSSTDISSQIGALELSDHLESHGDGVLETAAASPGTPTQYQFCTMHCVGDDPTSRDDGVLEKAAHVSIGVTGVPNCTRHGICN
jgi:hypothetical protein